jgi:di/tricarboxylate transporter
MTLRAGDSLVLHSYWRDLALAAESRDLVPVTDIPSEEQRPGKVRYALVFFALAMALGLFTDLRLAVAMMTGAVGMLLAGVLNMDEAYGAINWKTIFVMACLIPLGISMDSTGTAAWMAQEIMRYLGDLPQWLLQAFIAILALIASQVMSNVGAAVMMVPMAINVALASGGNPAMYALIVALSVSNTFLMQGASPVLLIVAGPGGYKSRDFLRVGLPLTVVMLVVTLVMVNVVF